MMDNSSINVNDMQAVIAASIHESVDSGTQDITNRERQWESNRKDLKSQNTQIFKEYKHFKELSEEKNRQLISWAYRAGGKDSESSWVSMLGVITGLLAAIPSIIEFCGFEGIKMSPDFIKSCSIIGGLIAGLIIPLGIWWQSRKKS